MFKRCLWIAITASLLISPVLGFGLDKGNTDKAIKESELIVTGTVSEVTFIYNRPYPQGSIHKTLNNLRGKLYKIQVARVHAVKPESTLSEDSQLTEFYILARFNKGHLVLDSSSGLFKGSQYLFFLNEDKSIDADFLEANQLPSAEDNLYLSFFNDSKNSFLNVKDARYKTILEQVQAVRGSETGVARESKQPEETN